jgi:hypothetical protein
MHLIKAWNMKHIKIIYSSSEIAADVHFFKVSRPAIRSVVAQLMNSLLPITLVFPFTQSVTLKMKAVCYSETSE